MSRWLFFVLAPGCGYTPPDVTRTAPEWTVPAIVTATAECSAADAYWAFEATTDAWTGNGQVVLSADGAYVEAHPMYSVGAAGDGSADSQRLALAIIPDWTDVAPGGTTAFNCDAEAISGVLRVYTRDGNAVADCRAFGVDPARWKQWDANVSCSATIELNDTGG